MIRVTIEMLPGGDEKVARVLGVGYIHNTGGSAEVGNYGVRLMKSAEYAKRGGVWKEGTVEGFPRLRLGPWDLLLWALTATVASRTTRKSQPGTVGAEPEAP